MPIVIDGACRRTGLYAECHYAEFPYAECCGAQWICPEAVFLVVCDPSMNEL
jgi:hypothetical protein